MVSLAEMPDETRRAASGRAVHEDSRAGEDAFDEDWTATETAEAPGQPEVSNRRGTFSLRASPLTRRIVILNLIALNILMAGILYLNASRDSHVVQHARMLASEAQLISNVIEARLQAGGTAALGTGFDLEAALGALDLRQGLDVLIFDTGDDLVGQVRGAGSGPMLGALDGQQETAREGGAGSNLWQRLSSSLNTGPAPQPLAEQLDALVDRAMTEGLQIETGLETPSGRVFAAVIPIRTAGQTIGAVAVTSPAGEIDALVQGERKRVLQMFVIAILVSVGLSLVLASTIANPLAELAAAAELGRDRDSRKRRPGRIRIPDLTARPDEIGRLSGALRGMVSALYNRIDANEQFASDVAHEIKNPLASLHSAVGTLRMIKDDDRRNRLLDVIEHDVRRLDRLVSDISNASRLDAELVKEEEQEFDLLLMLDNLNMFLGEDARSRGIDYITDMPGEPIRIQGLEARLAQVFVNLISNAISFCEEGDAIRVWVRKRENRVLAVVEDTGPGIPDEALSKIFKRFYSQRPAEHFGNNSGLGLAISKLIVEAHGGVIWAENIRPTETDITSDPLGARFVVGLPV